MRTARLFKENEDLTPWLTAKYVHFPLNFMFVTCLHNYCQKQSKVITVNLICRHLLSFHYSKYIVMITKLSTEFPKSI